MAGRGPAPKSNAARRNTQPSVPISGTAPEEAAKLHKRARYSAATQRWWDYLGFQPIGRGIPCLRLGAASDARPLVEAYWE